MVEKPLFDFSPVYKVWQEGIDEARKEIERNPRRFIRTIYARYSLQWWVLVVVHNSLVHPLLPIAEVLDAVVPMNPVSKAMFRFHDITVPKGAG